MAMTCHVWIGVAVAVACLNAAAAAPEDPWADQRRHSAARVSPMGEVQPLHGKEIPVNEMEWPMPATAYEDREEAALAERAEKSLAAWQQGAAAAPAVPPMEHRRHGGSQFEEFEEGLDHVPASPSRKNTWMRHVSLASQDAEPVPVPAAGPPASGGGPPAAVPPTTTPTPVAHTPAAFTVHPVMVGFLLALFCGITYLFNQWYMNRVKKPEVEGEDGSISDDESLSTQGLPEDTYGFAIASLVRDWQHIAKESGSMFKGLRVVRICSALMLLFFNMAIQAFLLGYISSYSVARAVQNVRQAYDAFERHMYGGHVYLTVNGMARGLDEKYFFRVRFDDLSEDIKGTACKIPFSQPGFLFIILLIWTLMVVSEIKLTIQLYYRLVWNTERATSMKDCTEGADGEEAVIKKLTMPVKTLLTFVILLPRVIITVILLWLGCRWLSATTDFQNLVLNAVGLEFILLTKELLYNTLVSDRNKRDTCRMMVNVQPEATHPTPFAFLGQFLWGIIAAAWVVLYIFSVQQVLPEYRFDVQEVCVAWMKENYAGWE